MTTYDTNGNDYTPIMLKDVKPGEFITRKPNTNNVYIRGAFERTSKKYSITATADHCKELLLKGSTIVYTGFTY